MKRFAAIALCLLLALTPALGAPALAANDLPEEVAVFYRQLSPAAQEFYDALCSPENLANFRSGEDIALRFTGNYGSPGETEQALQACFDAVGEAYAALLLTHPELFWLQGYGIGVSYSYGSGSFSIPAYLTPHVWSAWSSGARDVDADAAAVRAAAEALAEEASIQGGPWDQLAYVHDWLTTHNVYNIAAAAAGSDASDGLPWTPLSALTAQGQPVCEGYARAFQMVCDALGYPCLYVAGIANGGPHAWNQVQVAGKWYAVDVTFDDPRVAGVSGEVSGYENRDYFMVGGRTTVGGKAFSQTHIPDGVVTEGTSFSYPALADDALDPDFSWSPAWPGWNEPAEPEPVAFADVDEHSYYAAAVQWAVEVGVTNGTGTDAAGRPIFSPAASVTRGQAVTFLWRAMGEPEPDTAQKNPFGDVAETDYFHKAVLWAVANGITDGTGEDTFSPGDSVTRGQMLTFLWRAMGRPGESERYEGKAWYADAERWGDATGCIYGTGEAYSTAAVCPRSDVVYYLMNAFAFRAG